ncbi:MAG TPA: methyltransferase domain-containing protein [Burkholderiaceae bacterium]|nr:methyltransferase domain-containing protein [Burkholderiaceae bacterium]
MTSSSAVERPSLWVIRFMPLIPAGEVLDLACGGGRHARLLAGGGHRVVAVDRNADALAALAAHGIDTLPIDLEADGICWTFQPGRFAGIVVTNYLHRPLFPHIVSSLAPGGVLIYETFAQGNAQFGKPSNPDFLLRTGELLEMARASAPYPLRVIAFEDGWTDQPKPAMVQRICAIKQVQDAAPGQLRLF